MPKFKDPLPKNPFHLWGTQMGGAAGIDVRDLANALAANVSRSMNQAGIEVNAENTEITVGGLFNSTTFPGVEFSFVGRGDWARILVGLNLNGPFLSIDLVQQGTCSSDMRRLNVAESKGTFSLGGALRKAMTDQNAVEFEASCYGVLQDKIVKEIESWGE